MRNSFTYINIIHDALFTAERRRLQKNIDRLHEHNQEVLKERLDGFMFMGRYFKPDNRLLGSGARKTLALPLWNDMQAHLDDEKQLELDADQMRQTLFHLLEPCQSLEDIRDAVPECIVDTLPSEISSLQRDREPAWTIRDNERRLRQYQRIYPKFEFYSAARLIY